MTRRVRTNASPRTLGLSFLGPRRFVCALTLILGVAVLPACERRAPEPQTPVGVHDAPPGEPTHVYADVHGVIDALPTANEDLRIHHDAIPDFVNPRTGELNQNPDGTTGMHAMSMPFPLAPGVSLDGVEVGDHIRFTLALWTGLDTPVGFAYRVTALTEVDPPTDAEASTPGPDHAGHAGHEAP